MLNKILEISHITTAAQKELIKNLLETKSVDLKELYEYLTVLGKIKLDKSSFVSAILNFTYPYATQDDFDFVKNNFTQEVYDIFASLKQIEKYNGDDLNEAENFRMMLVAISKDIRVIIIKICGILFEVRKFEGKINNCQKDYLLQVKEIFAPLAERLGLNFMKSELEDICLKFLEPEVYDFLQSSVMLKKDENNQQIKVTKQKIENILKELKIDGSIMHRQKHFSSIHKKMTAQNINLAKIYDLIAMRVIVNSVEECYAVIGGIHGIYKPMGGRFKDYIANPKPNGYKSLHTTIIAENERPLEIQIRTKEMHKISEYGIAAHWIYKEKRVKKSVLDEKLGWIRSIMDNSQGLTSKEIIQTFKNQLNAGVIYVQTPKGKILEFPEEATLIDFAYAIHSDVGNTCVGGKINGGIKPLPTALKNGDVVEIITSSSSKGPSRDWLTIAKTASAKNKIKYFFRKEFKEEHIKNGKKIVEEEFKSRKLDSNKYLSGKVFENVREKLCYNEAEELYASVGYGSMSVRQVVNRLIAEDQKINKPKIKKEMFSPNIVVKTNKDGVLIDGDSGMLVRYANCCSPVMGDDIIGYISRGKGVTIHRKSCHNVKYLEDERLIDAEWQENQNKLFVANLRIVSENSQSYTQNVMRQLMESKTYILAFNSKLSKNNRLVTIVRLQVQDSAKLKEVARQIENFKETYEVSRIND